MQKRWTIALGALCWIQLTYAQITIDQTDFAPIGDTLIYGFDTTGLSGLDLLTPGPNRNWDFSTISNEIPDTVFILHPDSTPVGHKYPTSNYSFLETFSGVYAYFDLNASGLELNGLAFNHTVVPDILIAANITPDLTFMEFPADYQDTFSGFSMGFAQDFAGDTTPGPPPAVLDSFRIITVFNKADTVDAWGTVTTPSGTYDCIRQKSYETRIDSIFGFIFILPSGPSFWTFIEAQLDTNTYYRWWAKGLGNTYLEIRERANGKLASAKYLHVDPPPIAGFDHVQTDNLEITFTDQSFNAPNAWLWDFGDSQTDNIQDPVHTYGSPGTYHVCLTATNPTGNDTFCDSVSVITCTNPNASFSHQDTFLTVNFSDASTDALNWLWDFGDGNTDILANPSHTYDSAGTYKVCLTVTNPCGSDSSCMNITVAAMPDGISSLERVNRLEIAPNPSSGQVYLRWKGQQTRDLAVGIYSVTGQLIREVTNLPQNPMIVDLDDLEAGIYWIKLSQGGQPMGSGKIVLLPD